MQDNRTPRKILDTIPEEKRSVERPRLRRMDGVEDDLIAMGVTNWRRRTIDRGEWHKFLRRPWQWSLVSMMMKLI
jgi:hypothetical protein